MKNKTSLFSLNLKQSVLSLSKYFSYISFLLAQVFASFGIFERTNPFLSQKNFGRYGIIQVVAAAFNTVEWKKSNLDKILVLFAVVLSLLIVIMQALITLIYGLTSTANASLFTTPDIYKDSDVVLILLQQTFGIKGLSGGFFTDNTGFGASTPIHDAMYVMMGTYSTAIMIIAVILIVYYVFSVVGEAAYTGKPFGNRFNPLYAPIRIVLALGLLVPLGSGLNTAQYIVLFAAKAGSGLANNAWYGFIDSMNAATITPPTVYESNPVLPANTIRDLFRSEICRLAYNKQMPSTPTEAYAQVSYTQISRIGLPGRAAKDVTFYIPLETAAEMREIGTQYLSRYRNLESIKILYGTKTVPSDLEIPPDLTCGTHQFDFSILKKFQASKDPGEKSMVPLVWTMVTGRLKGFANSLAALRDQESLFTNYVNDYNNLTFVDGVYDQLKLILETIRPFYETNTIDKVNIATASAGTDQKTIISATRALGWGAAGMWYPIIGRYLRLSNQVSSEVYNSAPANLDDMLFFPSGSPENIDISQINARAATISLGLVQLPSNLQPATTVSAEETAASCTGWVPEGYFTDFQKTLEWVFATCKLRAMREAKTLDPIYQFTAFGIEKIDRSIRLLMYAGGSSVASIAASYVSSNVAQDGWAAAVARTVQSGGKFLASVFITLATIGLVIGFLLAYLLPSLPFLFFMIAVVSWVMAILQALVGLPLWALAHIRIGGDNLPGPDAMAGYQMMFEIFIRPIVIVISLIGLHLLLNAATYYISALYFPSAQNTHIMMFGSVLSGIDEFFMTILFAITLYGIIVPMVKAIDKFPSSIVEWGGFKPGYQDPLGADSVLADQRGILIAGGAIVQQTAGQASGLTSTLSSQPAGLGTASNPMHTR